MYRLVKLLKDLEHRKILEKINNRENLKIHNQSK